MALKPKIGVLVMALLGDDYNKTAHMRPIAQKAAGKVHSDIERGFIHAEVISFDELLTTGNLQTAREKGLLRLEGKTYEVRDGDIINFRFNV